MPFDVRFRQPSNILISGPSQSGKSNFIYKLRELFKNKEKVIKSIGRKSNSIKRRKRLLVQHGGTLGTVLSIAATILSGLLFGHS